MTLGSCGRLKGAPVLIENLRTGEAGCRHPEAQGWLGGCARKYKEEDREVCSRRAPPWKGVPPSKKGAHSLKAKTYKAI